MGVKIISPQIRNSEKILKYNWNWNWNMKSTNLGQIDYWKERNEKITWNWKKKTELQLDFRVYCELGMSFGDSSHEEEEEEE